MKSSLPKQAVELIAKQNEQGLLVINEDVEVIEYMPDVFAYLRAADGIDEQAIRKSLSPKLNRDNVFKAGESQGKSGSFFFFSHDKNFIIKTMTDSDLKTWLNLAPAYFNHLSHKPNSLLARNYGVFTVKMEDIEPVHLILMGNSKRSNDKNLDCVFDLKGSMINRIVKGNNLKNTATLKD